MEYCILGTDRKSRLIISASSPWSEISKDHEELWVNRFFNDMDRLSERQRKMPLVFERIKAVVNYLMFPSVKL